MPKKQKSKWQELGYPKNHGKPWTIPQMWELVTLYAKTDPVLTWRSIADRLGRTISACQMRMWAIRLAFTLNKNLGATDIMSKLSSGDAVYHKVK